MKILVIDTETTGLPKRNTSIYNTNDWPYIIQLSYILFDINKKQFIYKCDEYINLPTNVIIEENSISIHGISNEMIKNRGVNLKPLLNSLNDILDITDLIVGHNISFDKQMLMVEYIRHNIQSKLVNKTYVCTMKKYVNFCKINNYNNKGYKYPKLSELYYHIFNNISYDLHNSYNDILICLRCYYCMEYNEDLLETSSQFISEYIRCFNSLGLISVY